MNKFDDILRENVKKAFSNYNSDHLADEGWDSFVALQKGRHRRTVIFPLWARAASILLLIGLGATIAYLLSVHQPAGEIISSAESAAGRNKEQVTPDTTPPAVTPFPESAAEPAGTTGRTEKTTPDDQPELAYGETFLKSAKDGNEGQMINETAEYRSLNPDILPLPAATIAFSELYNNSASDEIRPENSMSAITVSEGSEAFVPTPDTDRISAARRLMAGISGSMAQAGGTSSPASGLSMGFYLDQKLTRRISVRPGLALAIQSFGLENGSNPAATGYPISLADGANGTPFSCEGQLSMFAMEVPLNLVFRIVEKKRSGVFISAGASTLFYISQQFTADVVSEYTKMTYNSITGMYSSETRYSTVEVEKEFGSFDKADFFGLANLSAGYSFPYSKTGIMLVEPFVQLPVDDLTSLNIKIRYAGVSMKLQFGKKEKGK
ncbi:MAG: hypothetical protein WAW07_13330 [Bacteroidales bacterium]